MKLEFPRGDSYEKGFIMKSRSTREPVTEVFDEIYFTVKTFASDEEFLFQKTLTGGGITSDGEGHYTLLIAPEDTDDLDFREYDVDFEFVKGTFKRTFYGVLKLTKEVTHSNNE